MATQEQLPAIHESRLKSVLDELELLEPLLLGQLRCDTCGNLLDLAEVGGIVVDDPPRLLCSSLRCIVEADRGP